LLLSLYRNLANDKQSGKEDEEEKEFHFL
jgi:hypothetical protein